MANIIGCEVVSLENYYKSEHVKDYKYDDFSSLDISLLSKIGLLSAHFEIQDYGGKTNSCFKGNAGGRNAAFAEVASAMKAAGGAKIGATVAAMSAAAAAAITSSKKPLDSSLPSSSKRPKGLTNKSQDWWNPSLRVGYATVR